ncbi:AI-2E family transporter [Patescibacteria group bacterium]|nr:MAG: AI-2E family transporter [Patescibacteria group bacterium]
MPPRMSDAPHQITVSTSTFVKAVLVVLALGFIWFIRDVLAILCVAVLLAALIEPFADWCSRHHVPRGLGVIAIYLVFGGVLSMAAVLLIPVVIAQSTTLINNLTEASSGLTSSFAELKALSTHYGLTDNLRSGLESVQQAVAGSVAGIFSTLRGVIGGVAALFLVLVLASYMVIEEDVAKRYFKDLAPVEYQPYLTALFTKMQHRIGSWLRGQLLLGLIVGTAIFIGLSVIGVENALLLGLIAALFEMVPYVGPVLSLAPAALVGFAHDPVQGLMVVALYLVVQQVENNILVPKVMQKATGLNPVFSIVALLIGMKLGGFVGALLSIPVATMASVVLEDLFAQRA